MGRNSFLLGTMLVFGFLVTSCRNISGTSEEANRPDYCKEADTRYLVFLDKSSSAMDLLTSTDSAIVNDLVDFFEGKDQLNNGSKLWGYYLHENTLGGSPFLSERIDVECPNIENLGARSKDKAKEAYNEDIMKGKETAITKLKEAFRVKNDQSTKSGTDIWATFELMSRFFEDAPDATKVVFYISDMKESMPGDGRRNLHKTLPATKAEAESMALADAEVIKRELKVKPEALSGVEVRLFFPDLQLAGSDKALVLYYWEGVFGAMGVGKVKEGVR